MINELVTGDTAAGDTEAKRVPQKGTSGGAALVHVVNPGGGEGGGGLTEQQTADAMATAPTSAPDSDSLTDYMRRVAEAAEDNNPVQTVGTANILMGLGTARRVTAGSTSASESLTASGIVGVSITAVGAAIRYNINAAATATSHYLPEGQSRDFKVAPSTVIHAIRADSTDGVLEITELLA